MMHRVFSSTLALLAASVSLLGKAAEAKLVFAHYLVGGIDGNTDHAQQDIEQAVEAGFDAFALNIGRPTEDWLRSAVNQLFNYADTRDDFKLFFSFDFYQTNDINTHAELYKQYAGRSSYLRYGDANLPVVSSYSGGGIGIDAWKNFKTANNVYLIPNPESDGTYYSEPQTFFQNWGDAIDGVFSWETNWPDAVKTAADAAGKSYVMGLSSLQYKHCCGDSWYRSGETTLLERMNQILQVSPEFVEVITWNDAGESHYVGPSWPETVTEEILQYGDTDAIPHNGWQPLISSFIKAFKDGASDTSSLAPTNGASFAGAFWYRGVLKSCINNGADGTPRGSGGARDTVVYAVILPAGSQGFQIRVSSGDQVLATQSVAPGLSYNSIEGLKIGGQLLELLDSSGNVVAKASSKVDVSDQPTNGFCNFNYYVAEVDPLIHSYSHLADFPRAADALHTLKKVASLVKPLMRARGWKVGQLTEFYPNQQNLLGLNVDRGQRICLRLRYPGDRNQFLPIGQVADTMLHELAHNVHGPHDAKFHALWNQLRDEHLSLTLKGYTGEGFLSEGHRLGGGSIPMHEARRLARVAAEKRQTLSSGSGQRLGGATPRPGQDIRNVIGDAVERRNRTLQGCANDNQTQDEIVEIANTATRNGFRTQADEDAANDAAIAQVLWEIAQEEELAENRAPYMPPNTASDANRDPYKPSMNSHLSHLVKMCAMATGVRIEASTDLVKSYRQDL
ncbi:hypothetical protein GQX73_g4532 [Xylaria multiplex]|uniref:WLM domain-containing protein n=1 Tax=Xylaria multiplex TaxID=323545 RepID=A0A7C8N5V1_9PEZI|nr:hypothetical protein GQX73_g4532 [Xylaria multiplex]